MKRTRILTVTWLYAVLLLTILIVSVVALTVSLRRSRSTERVTEYTYVYVPQEESATEAPPVPDTAPTEEGWIMQAYSDRIGIFKPDGTLLHVLDTYIKTLPEADRRLLGEGIPIQTRAELYALIEDYTG